MAIWVGTSGYNYPEWRGSFYPEKLPARDMLPYYAQRLDTVEINYTFYRTPNAKTLEGWNHATPERFRLTLKAPKRITHIARLKDSAESVRSFCETASSLGPKLGVLLFQLPPFFRMDLAVFDGFLADDFPAFRVVDVEIDAVAEMLRHVFAFARNRYSHIHSSVFDI